jgi:succinyl-diaminopimelate desuccinylase
VVFWGEAAHTARPWLGRNAIHAAIGGLASLSDLPVRDVPVDGMVYREVVSVTTIDGGTATNVVPDRTTATVNVRYAPTHAPEEAERRLRELIGDPTATVEVTGNAPPGRVPSGNPLVERLRTAGDLAVGPKQAWTPVAEFGLVGVDAVNFGPGDPQYAHRDDERIEVDALVRSYDVLRAFLEAARAGEE